ncbi:hypothetical protein [Klebsiella variicola]|uniref:hypothetical protein n=1 Tax=Klebsiella variicola TaxID=244366 RepID=UPI00115BC1E1|nr:hypothetical protein [Klebsiella variicola]
MKIINNNQRNFKLEHNGLYIHLRENFMNAHYKKTTLTVTKNGTFMGSMSGNERDFAEALYEAFKNNGYEMTVELVELVYGSMGSTEEDKENGDKAKVPVKKTKARK